MATVAATCIGVVLVVSSAPLYAVVVSAELQDKSSVTVNFKLLDDYAVLVPGKLGNGQSIQMMIDTGSVDTMLDSSQVKRLKLRPQEDVQIVLSEQTMMAKRITLDHFEIGNLPFTNQSILAADLSQFSAALHATVDMVIGYNVLCRLDSFQIDYATRALLLVPAASGNINHHCDDHSLPIVNAVIAGREKALRLLVDTGSRGLMLFGQEEEYGASTIDATGGIRSKTLPGVSMKRVQLPDLDFGGGTVVRNPRGYLMEPRPPNLFWIDGFIGGGGETGLSFLTINTRQQTVRFRFRDQR